VFDFWRKRILFLFVFTSVGPDSFLALIPPGDNTTASSAQVQNDERHTCSPPYVIMVKRQASMALQQAGREVNRADIQLLSTRIQDVTGTFRY
jgi:hypothetical protein